MAEFLGANILDDKPFLVMPYLKNGNARDYLHKHPNGNRLQIVRTSDVALQPKYVTLYVQLHGVSLGLVYLHSHQIVHGDLKAVRLLACQLIFAPLMRYCCTIAQCANRQQWDCCTL